MSWRPGIVAIALGTALASAPAIGGSDAPQAPIELLWPGGAPGALGQEDPDKPWLWVYLPPAEKVTGAAVVVCPGGGYGHLAVNHEGEDVARWLNELGVAAFVLKYRLAPKYHHPAPLTDAQRAVRWVRSRAGQYGLDVARIGVMGFSAGGHLASTIATHFDQGQPQAPDPIDQVSCRPDFAILCYPVITMDGDVAHAGSRTNLLGEMPHPALVQLLSNDLQVTPETPPTFLFHTNEDEGVLPENSVRFYLALRKAKVPSELHIYEKGPHGVGLAPMDPVLASWPARCAAWLEGRGVLKKG